LCVDLLEISVLRVFYPAKYANYNELSTYITHSSGFYIKTIFVLKRFNTLAYLCLKEYDINLL